VRACRKRLLKMIASIGERLAAKLANANDNAFKMRRLFKMYDEDASGRIHLDDLRMMMETFGVQLDDDSLLALYHVYDKECTGYLKYDELMQARAVAHRRCPSCCLGARRVLPVDFETDGRSESDLRT
jgi:EF-hand domain pair